MARQLCRWNPDQKMMGCASPTSWNPTIDYAAFPAFEDDPASRKWNLWSYIDARDGAQAVVGALVHDRPGFDIFNVANPDTVMSRPSADLMAEFFPDVKFRTPVEGTQALCSIDKARRVLNWQPQHTWRNQ